VVPRTTNARLKTPEASAGDRFAQAAHTTESSRFAGPRGHPGVHLAASLCLFIAVRFLQGSDELLDIALDPREVVAGELPPLLLGLTGQLLSFSFEYFLIHSVLLQNNGILLIPPSRRGLTHLEDVISGLEVIPRHTRVVTSSLSSFR